MSLSELLTEQAQNIVEVQDLLIVGNSIIESPVTFIFKYADEESLTSRGSIVVSSNDVSIVGLRLDGNVIITTGCKSVNLEACRISGAVKVEHCCEIICLKECQIEALGKVGVNIGVGSCVRLDTCNVIGSLVGVSVLSESVMVIPSDEPAVPPNIPSCIVNNCSFESNSTDIVAQIMLRSGSSDQCIKALVWPAMILQIEGQKEPLKVDVSLSGRFDKPICFKEWPIPLSKYFPQSTMVPRRGNRSNGRMCHLEVVGESLVITEDPFVGSDLKRKRTGSRFTRAEIHFSEVLGIPPGSDEVAVMSAFRRLALKHHPDKQQGSDDTFIAIKNARDQLMKIVGNRIPYLPKSLGWRCKKLPIRGIEPRPQR